MQYRAGEWDRDGIPLEIDIGIQEICYFEVDEKSDERAGLNHHCTWVI